MLGFDGIREDSLGFARIRWVSQDSLGFARIRWDSLGFARIRGDLLGFAEIKRASRSLTKTGFSFSVSAWSALLMATVGYSKSILSPFDSILTLFVTF